MKLFPQLWFFYSLTLPLGLLAIAMLSAHFDTNCFDEGQ